MADRFVTETECALRTKNVEQSLKRIEEAVSSVSSDVSDVSSELKEFKDLLNPAFNTVKRQLEGHMEQDGQDRQRRRDKWSPWQLVITAIVALAAVGMFIVSIVK